MSANPAPPPAAFAPVPLMDIALLYRIRLHRIARGYTPEQLSVLIGRPPAFLRRQEERQSLRRLTAKDLHSLAVLFGVCPRSFFPEKEKQAITLSARAYTEHKDGLALHTVEQQLESGEVLCLYRLYEQEG